MTPTPEIALLVCTYQRPRNLALCLESIARQDGVGDRMELAIADDGSTDDTAAIVDAFRRRVGFRVSFTTHEHDRFHPARCRNEAARATQAPYLLFIDGDCVIPRDHVRTHLDLARDGSVLGSDCVRLTEEQSARVAASDAFDDLDRIVPWSERWRVRRDHLDARMNWLFRNPNKPKLFSNDFSLSRHDFERVNGFDEAFRDWGGEDDDLRLRLLQAGMTIRSVRDRARAFHLWHPPDPSAPARWRGGRNVDRLQRPFRLTRCVDGLVKRRREDLAIRIINGSRFPSLVHDIAPFDRRPAGGAERADVEILFLPGDERFTGNADCNVLVIAEPVSDAPLTRSHILVTDVERVRFGSGPRFGLRDIGQVWKSIL